MSHATAAKDATTDLDPSEFRYVANFATVACGSYASAAAFCFAYPNISPLTGVNFHEIHFQTREQLPTNPESAPPKRGDEESVGVVLGGQPGHSEGAG